MLKGFIQPGVGKTWLPVSKGIASRITCVAKSLEFHSRHNGMCQKAYPSGSQATRAAKKCVTKREYKEAMATHLAANVSKHVWEDSWSTPAVGEINNSTINACTSRPPPLTRLNGPVTQRWADLDDDDIDSVHGWPSLTRPSVEEFTADEFEESTANEF
eukprot:349815-Karenia_brevis.AAC.1